MDIVDANGNVIPDSVRMADNSNVGILAFEDRVNDIKSHLSFLGDTVPITVVEYSPKVLSYDNLVKRMNG